MGALYKQRGPLTTNPLSGNDKQGLYFNKQARPPTKTKVCHLCFNEFSFYRWVISLERPVEVKARVLDQYDVVMVTYIVLV